MPDTEPKLRPYQIDALLPLMQAGYATARIVEYCKAQGFPVITASAVSYHRKRVNALTGPIRRARYHAAVERGLALGRKQRAETDRRRQQWMLDNPPAVKTSRKRRR